LNVWYNEYSSKRFEQKYLENVQKLSKLKIINGYPDKTFRGENPVTRAEAVSFLKRTLDKELELDSTYVFFWDETPEGVDFWENIYWDFRNRHISLKDLLNKPFAIEINDPFIYLEPVL
jgi:hypothetical protein